MYTENWESLEARLQDLDVSYLEGLSRTRLDEVIVTHEAYGYLASRYGFVQRGVIGISADEQPSASALGAIVELMEAKGIFTVYMDPVYSGDFAQVLRDEMESQTGRDVAILKLYPLTGPVDGKDMIKLMWVNLENLRIGLEVEEG